jgi:3-oxoacyl-[acyl-carrier-protein] synthase II
MVATTPIHVTGMAWATALGDDLEQVWERLLAGETGLVPHPHPGRLRNPLAAVVPSSSEDLPPAVRLVEMASRTIRQALAEAQQDAADPRVRLILGTSLGAYLEEDSREVSLHAWAEAVGRAVGAVAPPITVATACSAGSDAILLGAELLRAGAARCCVCGGADVLTWSKRLAHSALGTMSPTTLRAFDVRHDGTLLGEGAAFLVLEPADRGRKSHAILRGAGSANDASAMTAPDTSALGARYALERSLADAQLPPEAIGLINAHGSGTPLNDSTESRAFRDIFGGRSRPPVFATKGNFGHSLGATGAIEAIALLLALRTRRVPPIVGLEQPDPDFPLPLPRSQPRACDARLGLSLTLGFGGFDTSLVFEVPS